MHVYEQSPEKTPELFYLPDAGGNPTVPVRQDIGADGIRYTRKSAMGVRQTWLTPNSAVLLNGPDEDNLAPVMTQHVIQEVSDDGGLTWYVPEVTERTIDANGDGLIDYLLTVGVSSYCRISTVDNYFLEKCGKQEYEISAPGKLTRLYLEVTLHDPDQARVDISDFDGPVIYNTVDNVVTYLFYPDGVEYAVIDPYLTVEETSVAIYVDMDALTLNFNNNSTAYSSVQVCTLGYRSTSGIGTLCGMSVRTPDGTTYSLPNSKVATYTLLENTPTRVIIATSYNLTTIGGTPLTGSTSFDAVFYIYNDRVFIATTWVTGAEITLQSSNPYHHIIGVDYATVATPVGIYESGGSELTSSGGTYDSADYVGTLADEFDSQTIVTYSTVSGGGSNIRQFLKSSQEHCIQYQGTIYAGTHKIFGVTTFEKTQAERLTLGNQYKDIVNNTNLPTIVDSTGAFSVPTAFQVPGEDAFGTDGAYHLDGSV